LLRSVEKEISKGKVLVNRCKFIKKWSRFVNKLAMILVRGMKVVKMRGM
jgi:hypothetical protein